MVRSLTSDVEDLVSTAMAAVLSPEMASSDPLIRRSDHADFQSNVALPLAKQAKAKPREVAGALEAALPRDGLLSRVELAGPGFLNLTLADAAIWGQVAARLGDDRLGVGLPQAAVHTVIDYSAPNIAKEMHVGHLRTTIIGDALARVMGFLGGQVTRQNHFGDWGTQFGMLIQYLDEHPDARWRHEDLAEGVSGAVSALDSLYRAARKEFEADEAFADRARSRVVALQAGDEATLARWHEIVAESQLAFQTLYDRLGVLLGPEDAAGESTYNPYLEDVVAELRDKGILVESNGALCVFFDEVKGTDGEPVPLIVRKKDGGYGYATTDLATIRHRICTLKADRVLYVVDARQALHFRMIFETARRAGWLTGGVEVAHVPFGTVLGPDGRPFKTRAGDTVRLSELLDEAVAQARAAVQAKSPDMGPDQLERIAALAGIGAVKYADLSTSRTKDYVFDAQRMVALNGNTGVYLQYAHARIRSILARVPEGQVNAAAVHVDAPLEPAERALALLLDEFGDTLSAVATTLEPHRLCAYLFALAKACTDFYETCPVLKAETTEVRSNRIALCRLAGDTLAQGLDLLGIGAPARI